MRGFLLFCCVAAVTLCVVGVNPVPLLRVYNITLPANLSEPEYNFRVQGVDLLSTRLYNSPVPGGNLLVGWTDDKSVGHVSYLTKDVNKGYVLKKTVNLSGRQVRGIAALNDTSFGVLAWVYNSDFTKTKMYVRKYSSIKASGTPTQQWETQLANSDNFPSDFSIGDSRMIVDDNGDFYVYYHVHSDDGHEGDTYYKVSKTGKATKIWNWGCSHSMSNLLSYHPVHNKTLSLCVTDCYPGTSGDFSTDSIGGLYTEDSNLLQKMSGGCNGCVGGEIGMVGPMYSGGWAVIFNSQSSTVKKGQSACRASYNQDVGVALVNKDKTLKSVSWLTKTNDDEIDPGLARYGKFVTKQSFLVGWKRGNDVFLATMNTSAKLTAGPYNATKVTIDGVSTRVSWGSRDDTWRTLDDGSVAWLEAPEKPANRLRVFVVYYGSVPKPPEPSSSSSPKPVSSLTPSVLSSDSEDEDSSNSTGPLDPEAGLSVNPCAAIIAAIMMLFFLALF